MHYDHCGNYDLFPRARYHLQDREMAYATGRCMCHQQTRLPFEVEDVVAMVRKVFSGRAAFHDGADEVVPGVTVHHIGGHSMGLQSVRVKTRRGHVVLAADASHLYAHLDSGRVFPIVYNVAEVVEGYETLKKLATSPGHIVPGHDPLVLTRYPAAKPGLEGWIVRLELPARPRCRRQCRAGRGGEDRRHGSADPAGLGDPVQRSGAGRPDQQIVSGAPGKLSKEHKAFLARLVEEGPIPAVHGVVRWRACDLIMRLHEEFGISVSDDTVYRALKELGFSHVSARPKAYKQDPEAMEAFKKTFPPAWPRSALSLRLAHR